MSDPSADSPSHSLSNKEEKEENEPLRPGQVTLRSSEESPELNGRAVAGEPRLICDVELSVIEDFLLLIRENYSKADKAMFFLEQKSGILNLQAITNVRDVLSHLSTILKPELTEEQRRVQLGNAEEHLRRAIIEPYEIALSDLMTNFDKMYDEYKKLVLPMRDAHAALQHAPNVVSIEASLRQIGDLASKGRTGKGKNLWNREWEEGVTSFVDAFDRLTTLHVELEGYLFKAQQIEREGTQAVEIKSLRAELQKESRRSTLLHVGGYILAVILAILAVSFFPSLIPWIRRLLHLQ
jgi:hypothetical protein